MSDDDKKIEDMPLADLLGMGGGEPQRVQEREDEPGSGIAKLAQMVASSSVADAKRPSITPSAPGGPVAPPSAPVSGASVPPAAPPGGMGTVPPPGGVPAPAGSIPPPAGPVGSMPPGGSVPSMGAMTPGGVSPEPAPSVGGLAPTAEMPGMGTPPPQTGGMPAMGGMQPTAAMPATGGLAMGADDLDGSAIPRKRSSFGLIVAIAAVVVAAGVSAAIFLSGEDEDTEGNEQIAALENQLEELKNAKQKLAEAEKEAEKVAAEANASAEAAEVAAKAEAEQAAAAAEAEEPAEEAAEEAPAPAKKTSRKRVTRATRKTAQAKSATKAKTASKKESSNEVSSKSELGALLDNDVASGKKSPTGKLAKTPSRAEVKSSMAPVARRAAKCAKYSKGTVKLKITVGSNGRVTQSSPVGGTAGATAGNCVAMIARTAKFPKFSNPSFTFNYPIRLK